MLSLNKRFLLALTAIISAPKLDLKMTPAPTERGYAGFKWSIMPSGIIGNHPLVLQVKVYNCMYIIRSTI